MTGSEGHRARMDSATPRGYGVRGDVRKRLEGQHQAHPDPAVRELMARAWDEGWSAAWSPLAMHNLNEGPNPYRSKP